jgi:hypothetical protein
MYRLMMKHTHTWTPINGYLKQCRCGAIRTTGPVFDVPCVGRDLSPHIKARKPKPPKVLDEGPAPAGDTITTREIMEAYGVSDNTVSRAYLKRHIYRVRIGHYDRKSVEGHFGDSRKVKPDHRDTVPYGPTKGIRVPNPLVHYKR